MNAIPETGLLYWSNPSQFKPDRFKNSDKSIFTFVPQGVGDHLLHHRCPGEFITVELMKTFSDYLVNRIEFIVPAQDLSLDMARLPGLPKSHLILSHVKRTNLYLDVTA